MAQITLTRASDNAPFSINEDRIYFFENDTLGAEVYYAPESGDQIRSIQVNESPIIIQSISDNFVAITLESGETAYYHIDKMSEIYSNDTGAYFLYDKGGSQPMTVQSSMTLTALKIRVVNKNGDLAYNFDDVNATNSTFSLTAANGDLTAKFTSGVALNVFGNSTDSVNGLYTVSSSTYSGGKTVITVNETVPSGASETGGLWIQG